jgi:hypothetical protein
MTDSKHDKEVVHLWRDDSKASESLEEGLKAIGFQVKPILSSVKEPSLSYGSISVSGFTAISDVFGVSPRLT